MRKALFPFLSFEIPIILPGILRLYFSVVAKNAACGPPKPKGTPIRCEEPKTTSAPHSPGGVSNVKLSKSVATAIGILYSLDLLTMVS